MIGVLNFHNLLTGELNTSSVKRLFGRHTKSMVPATENELRPH